MKILILGDVMGASGRNALINKLPINKNDVKLDFILTEKGIY